MKPGKMYSLVFSLQLYVLPFLLLHYLDHLINPSMSGGISYLYSLCIPWASISCTCTLRYKFLNCVSSTIFLFLLYIYIYIFVCLNFAFLMSGRTYRKLISKYIGCIFAQNILSNKLYFRNVQKNAFELDFYDTFLLK